MTYLRRYTADDKPLWDSFVLDSKNGTFLFQRNFMEYHQDRFVDHSLLFFDAKNRLVALLPANETKNGKGEKTLISHQGLTYGGFILSAQSGVTHLLHCMKVLMQYLQENQFKHFIYKAVPSIYHRLPAQEDLYALFRYNAHISACNISCSIALQSCIQTPTERRRCRGLAKAEILGYLTCEGSLSDFWPIMQDNLMQRYQASPVHSLSEMQLLQKHSPKTFGALSQ